VACWKLGRDIVARVERLIAEIIVCAAVPLVGSAARAQVDYAAIEAAKLSGTLFDWMLNSWISSTIGKKTTCPGSGCRAEIPSKRYSFVRGRPPLMRGNCVPGGNATPGACAGKVDKVAGFSGMSEWCCRG